MSSLEYLNGSHGESRVLVVLCRVPVLEVATDVRFCCELLWAFRLVVNVESGSSTLWTIRAKHLASGKGAAFESQASGRGYLLTQVQESQVPSTNTKFSPLHTLKQRRRRTEIPDCVCLCSHEKDTKSQKLEPETRPEKMRLCGEDNDI